MSRRLALTLVAVLLPTALSLPAAAGPVPAQPYARLVPPLNTPWTDRVSTTSPLPEYPRPQLVRREWQSLNGQWDYWGAGLGSTGTVSALPSGTFTPPPLPSGPPQTVLVPYPVTSALSGIGRQDQVMRYERTFRVPSSWSGRQVVIHFGGVTWHAEVSVNGTRVGSHSGSYDAFDVDVTDAFVAGDNTLTVDVVDPGSAGGQPLGKQFYRSMLILFTPASGIWQSVWMEPVAPAHLTDLTAVTDLRTSQLRFLPTLVGGDATTRVRVTVTDEGRLVGTAEGPAAGPVGVTVRRPHLWTPDDPHLYDVRAEVLQGGAVVDRVTSYAGMRTVRVGVWRGVPRLLLNDRPVFSVGALDHGYWPDGIYTAPTDEALRYDLEKAKALGFNTLRKHMKVEPQRWYYWADRLGVMVWQDMPSMTIYRPVTPPDKQQFDVELAAMVRQHRSHPSVITWVPWNEGWGQYDLTSSIDSSVAMVKRLDPSRPVDGHSGAANCCTADDTPSSDFEDSHLYNGPWAPRPKPGRASVIGEMGGIGGRVPGHDWHPEYAADPSTSADGGAKTPATRLGLLTRQWAMLAQQVRDPGLSGAVFTELFDTERESGGFFTYDRKVDKVAPAAVRALNRRLLGSFARDVLGGRRPAPPVPAPVAAWALEEGSGTTAAGAGPRALLLTLTAGASWVDGVRGKALAFDGRQGQAATSRPVVDTSHSFTVAAWVRHADRLQSAAAVSQDGASVSAFALGQVTGETRTDLLPGYAFRPPDPQRYPHTRWSFDVTPDGSCSDCYVSANTTYDDGLDSPAAGRWQYVVGVYDRATGTGSLYVDGVPQDASVLSGSAPSVGPFRLAAGGGGAATFQGAVDEVAVWDRALTPEQVAAVSRRAGVRSGP